MTNAGKEDMIVLDKLSYIHYPIQSRKEGKKVTRALINNSNEVNAIILAYTQQIDLQTQQINKAKKPTLDF